MWYLVLHRKEYDAVICVPCAYLTDLIPACVASLLAKTPYIIRTTSVLNFEALLCWKSNSVDDFGKKLLLPPPIWRCVFRRAAVVVTQSPVIREMATEYGISNADVVLSGIDVERFDVASKEEVVELRLELNLPADKIIIISTGRYVAEKNQMALIKAAEEIETNLRPGKMCVLLIGATERHQVTSNEKELKSYAARKKLNGLVRFFDDVANVENYLRASDIFVLSSFNEGMPNSVLEAMSCGLPVVCSNLPQITQAFPDGKGFFFSPSDVDGLVAHLINLMDSEILRQSTGSALAAYARERFSSTRTAAGYANLLNNILKSP
jgi:glycosyltransferase involved in cell wall biosynthesis